MRTIPGFVFPFLWGLQGSACSLAALRQEDTFSSSQIGDLFSVEQPHIKECGKKNPTKSLSAPKEIIPIQIHLFTMTYIGFCEEISPVNTPIWPGPKITPQPSYARGAEKST